MSTSKGSSTSAPAFQTFGGSYGDTDYSQSRKLSQQAEGMIGQKSAFATPLESMLLNPQYGASNPNGSALINSLLDATAGRTATRGLGAPTQGAMASAIAPTLVDLRNQEIQNLLGAQGAETQRYGMDMQSLLEMIGYAMPQIMGGQTSSETSKSRGISFCWVAREVYGENDRSWMNFKSWMFCCSPGWFFRLYGKYGERFAKFISDKPMLKTIIRKWMDTKIRRSA